jgi:hypothetical protein
MTEFIITTLETQTNFVCTCAFVNSLLNRLTLVDIFFLNLHSGGWNQGPLDTAAT